MEIGSLFFALGFKGTGSQELNKYETAIDGAQGAAQALQDTWEEMLYVMEKMAVKIGAITDQELDLHKADMQLLRDKKAAQPVEREEVKNLDKKNGLISQAHQKLVGLVGKMNAYRIELYGSSAALIYFTKKMADMAIHLDKVSTMTGIPIEKMQRLGDMASQTGASMDDLASAVRGFQENSINIMMGKGGEIGAFQMLGLSPHEDPIKMLGLLQEKLKKMPTVLGNKLAKDIGLSDDLIYMLRNSDKLEAAPEETFLSEKELKRLKEFGFYFNKVFGQVQRVMSKLAATTEPFVRLLLYGLERITQLFGRLIDFGSKYQETITNLLKILGVMAFAAAAFFQPWLAGLALFLLAWEDIDGYIRGDKSFIGYLIKEFSNLNSIIENTISLIGSIISLGAEALGFVGGGLTSKMTGGSFFSGAKEGAAKMQDIVGNATAWAINKTQGAAGMLPGAGKGAGDVTNNNNIVINGAQDPTKTGEAVHNAINKQHSDAVYQQPQTGR